MARKALTVPLEYIVGRGMDVEEARAVGRVGTLGEYLDTVLGSVTLYWNGQGDGLRTAWEGLLRTPSADLLSCIALLARAVGSRDPILQQLYCTLLTCQRDLRHTARDLQSHADQNARIAGELQSQPASDALARERQDRIFLAWCEGMLAERAQRIADSCGRHSFPPFAEVSQCLAADPGLQLPSFASQHALPAPHLAPSCLQQVPPAMEASPCQAASVAGQPVTAPPSLSRWPQVLQPYMSAPSLLPAQSPYSMPGQAPLQVPACTSQPPSTVVAPYLVAAQPQQLHGAVPPAACQPAAGRACIPAVSCPVPGAQLQAETSARSMVGLQPLSMFPLGAQPHAQLPAVLPARGAPLQAAALTGLQVALQSQHNPAQCIAAPPGSLAAGVLQGGSSEDFANACSGLTQRFSTSRARAPDKAQQQQMHDNAAAVTGPGTRYDGLHPRKRARLDERAGTGAHAGAQQAPDRALQAAAAQGLGPAVSPEVDGVSCVEGEGVLPKMQDRQLQHEGSPQMPIQAATALLLRPGVPGSAGLLTDAQCLSMHETPIRLSAILRGGAAGTTSTEGSMPSSGAKSSKESRAHEACPAEEAPLPEPSQEQRGAGELPMPCTNLQQQQQPLEGINTPGPGTVQGQAASFHFAGHVAGKGDEAAAAQPQATPALHAWQGGHATADQPIGETPGGTTPKWHAAARHDMGCAVQHGDAGAGAENGASGEGTGGGANSCSAVKMVPDSGSGLRLSEALAGAAAAQQLLLESQRGSNSPGKRKGGLQARPATREEGGPPAAPDQAPCAELSSQGRQSAAGSRGGAGAADGGNAQDGGSQPGQASEQRAGSQPSQLRPQEVFPLSGRTCGAPGSPRPLGQEPLPGAGDQPQRGEVGGAGAGQAETLNLTPNPRFDSAQQQAQWLCAVRALSTIGARQLRSAGPALAAQAFPAADDAAQELRIGAEAPPAAAACPEEAPGGEPTTSLPFFSARSPGKAQALQPSSEHQACELQEALKLSMAWEQLPAAAAAAPVAAQSSPCGKQGRASSGGRSVEPDQAVTGRRSKRSLWHPASSQKEAPAALGCGNGSASQGAVEGPLNKKRRRTAPSPEVHLRCGLGGVAWGSAPDAVEEAAAAAAEAGMPVDGMDEAAMAGMLGGAGTPGASDVDDPQPPLPMTQGCNQEQVWAQDPEHEPSGSRDCYSDMCVVNCSQPGEAQHSQLPACSRCQQHHEPISTSGSEQQQQQQQQSSSSQGGPLLRLRLDGSSEEQDVPCAQPPATAAASHHHHGAWQGQTPAEPIAMRRGPAGDYEKSPWETPCFPAHAQGLHALTQETPLVPSPCTQLAALGPAAGAAQGATLRMMSLGHRGSQYWTMPGAMCSQTGGAAMIGRGLLTAQQPAPAYDPPHRLSRHVAGEASREQGSCLPLLASQGEGGPFPEDLLPPSQTPLPTPSPS